jgi:endonuclease/exonuclease/phosphatase family metal-dependent hydrolase
MGDFNMRPDDPVKRRISEPFEGSVPRDGSVPRGGGIPALVDSWRALHGDAPHPVSFCLYEQSSGPPHCCDFMFVTEDLAPKIRRIVYEQETQASDHQPVLLELDL